MESGYGRDPARLVLGEQLRRSTDQGGGKRRAAIAGQCAKLSFAHKERFNACWTN
jgi:hypothetical protein